jgi:hypothetical protein
VSLKHFFSLMTSRHTSLRQKLGFFTLLFFRELFVYLTFHPIILVVIYVIRDPGSLAVQLLFLILGASLMHCAYKQEASHCRGPLIAGFDDWHPWCTTSRNLKNVSDTLLPSAVKFLYLLRLAASL